MAKAKLTNFATVLRLLPMLTDDEKATLRDVLRPEPAKRGATKKASKKPKAAEVPSLPLVSNEPDPTSDTSADSPLCATCGNNEAFQDHFQPSPHYHPFELPSRAKAAGKRSSRNTESTKANGSGPATSETLLDSVGNVAHAVSASD